MRLAAPRPRARARCSSVSAQRGAVVDRRPARGDLREALELELLRGLVAGIEPAGGAQPIGRRGVAGEAVGLAREAVPAQAEPAQILLDRRRRTRRSSARDRCRRGAAANAPPWPAREQPVDQRAADIADDGEGPVGLGAKRTFTGHRRPRRRRRSRAARLEAVGDRIAPVAAEVAARDLHARRRLAALVLGDVEHAPTRGAQSASSWPRATMSSMRISFSTRQLEDVVEHRVGRQRCPRRSGRAELGRRRLGDDALGHHRPSRPERARRQVLRCASGESSKTVVL